MSEFNLKVYFLRYFNMYLFLCFVYYPLGSAVYGFEVNLLGHDNNKLINSVKDFSGFNFIFFFRTCNVASMAVTKSELDGQMFNEQFCMSFV